MVVKNLNVISAFHFGMKCDLISPAIHHDFICMHLIKYTHMNNKDPGLERSSHVLIIPVHETHK